MTWKEVCERPELQDLPYRIETNRRGEIVMSPTSYRHNRFSDHILRLLDKLMKDGEAGRENAIETPEGVRVPDVAWASRKKVRKYADAFAFAESPEICVEVMSLGNSLEQIMEKFQLYFETGAKECWLCDLEGLMTFFYPTGRLEKSHLCPDFPEQIKLKS